MLLTRLRHFRTRRLALRRLRESAAEDRARAEALSANRQAWRRASAEMAREMAARNG